MSAVDSNYQAWWLQMFELFGRCPNSPCDTGTPGQVWLCSAVEGTACSLLHGSIVGNRQQGGCEWENGSM